jgi:ubiquitin-like modifier-activating enzyme ATG7
MALIRNRSLYPDITTYTNRWGIKHLTFVDNGKVSYSNPVRQSLFDFDDCLNGGKAKATAAAEAIQKIFPMAVTSGHRLTIPMPGHILQDSQVPEALENIKALEALIDSHDLIFLLTDSRESRWLPTLLCAAKGKLLMNAALGFDTFVVLRHGCAPEPTAPPAVDSDVDTPVAPIVASPSLDMDTATDTEVTKAPTRLGCYFCNDVVAPGDSLRDRTLDQQCTVTRPGLANLAASYAVELAVSVLHHPDGKHAAAQMPGDACSKFGIVPHQLRGFLASYTVTPVVGQHFDRCSACSDAVVAEYHKRGADFLVAALRDPKILEDTSGLTALKEEADRALAEEDWGMGDGESGDDDF